MTTRFPGENSFGTQPPTPERFKVVLPVFERTELDAFVLGVRTALLSEGIRPDYEPSEYLTVLSANTVTKLQSADPGFNTAQSAVSKLHHPSILPVASSGEAVCGRVYEPHYRQVPGDPTRSIDMQFQSRRISGLNEGISLLCVRHYIGTTSHNIGRVRLFSEIPVDRSGDAFRILLDALRQHRPKIVTGPLTAYTAEQLK